MTKARGLQFIVVMLLALALVPVGAHLLALPNKIDLPEQEYFTAQAIYYGWSLPTGFILIALRSWPASGSRSSCAAAGRRLGWLWQPSC
jgi:hypothetical protein